jgi:Inner membrane protein YgaP-like, transmembrane domain
MTHERAGRLLAGISVAGVSALAWFHNPCWLLALAGIGLNLAMSAVTGKCAVKTLLVRLGLPGERELGVAEGMRLTSEAKSEVREGSGRQVGLRRRSVMPAGISKGDSDVHQLRN